jgi:4a-hydroxytetrahydrobiopterin dehydratase
VPRLLTPSEISARLESLKGWKHEGDFITKTFRFKSFTGGIEFINRVAAVAEREEHHPDIHVRYTTVALSLQTHSEGGVTEWDLGLAESIEKDAVKVSPKNRVDSSRIRKTNINH